MSNTPYNDGIDAQIGSLLERWITIETGEYCRFCRTERVPDEPIQDRFCSEDCEQAFETVLNARLEIGKRDMDQRGYD